MSLSYVEISGAFDDGQGNPLSGTAVFQPSQTVYSAGIPLVSVDTPVQAQIVSGELKNAGGGTLELLATDNPGLTYLGQTGWFAWEVSITIGGQVLDPWSFFLPHGTLGNGPVDLYSLANTGAGGGGGSGTVTSVAVESANGLAGTVASATTTPQITLSTTVTGLLKGNGTTVSAAAAGTDYLAPAGSGAALTGITAAQVGADASGAAASKLPLAGGTMSGAIAMGGNKITGGANGTASTDVALFGQVPSSSSPLSLTAGGTGLSESGNAALLTALGAAALAGAAFSGEVTVQAPVNPSDAVTKSYADAIAQGLAVKPSVQEATAAALPSNTYASGVLTAAANGALTVDGITVSTGDRVLVQNEAAPANNGIYTVTATGSAGAAYVLTRAADMASGSQVPGAFVFTEQGTVNAGGGFTVASKGPFTLGTTAITWTQFSGAGEITAGSGLTKSGNTISVSGPLSPSLGGTGQATLQAALNALAGAQTSGDYLRGNGTNVVMSAIQVADVPTLNQSTTGNAATATNLAGGVTLPAYLAPAVVALTFGSSIAVNAALGNVFAVTLTSSAATIANPSGPVDGQVIRFRIAQDATGSRTVAWGSAYDWGSTSGSANSAPTLTTAASKTDNLAFEYIAALSKWCYLGAPLPQGF